MNGNNEIQKRAQGILARAKSIITKPAETWQQIAGETDAPMQVFLQYAVPLAAIGPIASFIGGQVFGYGGFGFSYKPTLGAGLTQAVLSYVLALAGLWVVAWVANFLSPKFEGQDDFASAFRLAAYAFTASWLAQIFGLVPALSVLSLLGLYSFYLFYKGANPIMTVPQEKAIGYTAVTVIAAFVVNLVIGAITTAITAPAMLAGAGLSGSTDGSTSVDMGEYGSIEVDGDSQSVNLPGMGNIQIDAETGKATINVDGQQMTVDIPTEEENAE